tara:strand:- start:5160 stop:6146 length:987 start_codon:yes stop_codon:yes gene_type:complete
MKIVILGSGSFAGQIIFSRLINEGYEVIGINRSSPKSKYHWEWISQIKLDNYNWHEINLDKEYSKLLHLLGDINPTHIVDFMGQGMVAQSWDNPMLWYSTNIARKSFILEKIRTLKNLEKYVRASTPEVYGSNNNNLSESRTFSPSTPYAVSHCAIDYHIRCLGRNYDFPYSIGRFSNFYGEGQQLYRVIPKAILSCLTGKKFILDGNGKSVRSFIHSEDIYSAVKKLLFESKSLTEYNFSGKEEITIIELVKLICKFTNVNFEDIVEFGEDRMGKDLIYRLNCKKAEKDLNWVPNILLKDGLYGVSSWIKRNLKYFSEESWNYLHKC